MQMLQVISVISNITKFKLNSTKRHKEMSAENIRITGLEINEIKQLSETQRTQREKQIRYGKVTAGYQNYESTIPKKMRQLRDPITPNKNHPYSKRNWDGLVRSWRRRLHEWDDPALGLQLRAPYSSNNIDIEERGLLNFMFTPQILSICEVTKPGLAPFVAPSECIASTAEEDAAVHTSDHQLPISLPITSLRPVPVDHFECHDVYS